MKRAITPPGTCLPADDGASDGQQLLAPLWNICGLTGGLTLSQVCAITGLTPASIQNWSKRGFISSPHNRQYPRKQVARIVIINMLRDILPLERIGRLLSVINGDLLDESDDTIDDDRIYEHLCSLLVFSPDGGFDITGLSPLIDRYVDEQIKVSAEKKACVKEALLAILAAFEVSNLKKYAESLAEEVCAKADNQHNS